MVNDIVNITVYSMVIIYLYIQIPTLYNRLKKAEPGISPDYKVTLVLFLTSILLMIVALIKFVWFTILLFA